MLILSRREAEYDATFRRRSESREASVLTIPDSDSGCPSNVSGSGALDAGDLSLATQHRSFPLECSRTSRQLRSEMGLCWFSSDLQPSSLLHARRLVSFHPLTLKLSVPAYATE